MISRFVIIFSFILIGFVSEIHAQTLTIDVVEQKLFIPQDTILNIKQNDTQLSPFIKKLPFIKIYHNSLGLFCHAENKMAKSSRIPIKMRLGTVQYVDKIEGKN